MENLSIKGVIEMPNKNGSEASKGNGSRVIKSNDGYSNERGSQSVPPSQSSAPPRPPKQK
jgi:hypothetical protein